MFFDRKLDVSMVVVVEKSSCAKTYSEAKILEDPEWALASKVSKFSVYPLCH